MRGARARNKLHGAYLLEGASGTGKTEIVCWFAKLLLCRAGGDDPCGECHDCRLLSSNDGKDESEDPPALPGHPDLKWVQPDGAYVKVDQIRDLQRDLSLVANEGGRRVGLVLGAERLRVEAANALLKTLEEPPEDTVLILVAESSEALPKTLRSRTVRLRLVAPRESEVREQLIAEGLSESEAWLASTVSGGSAEHARAWAQTHSEDAAEIRTMIEGIAACGASEILEFCERFRGGEVARKRTELFMAVHDALTRGSAEAAAQQGNGKTLTLWLERFEAGRDAQREMRRRNLNPQLVVEGLLMDLRASI
ncbi:MAG: DNA polymerase III subunit [bacterium]|nr:DNA polymerase III subunit [bacterium]